MGDTRIDLLRRIADHGGRYFYDDAELGDAFTDLEDQGLVDLHEDEDDVCYATLTDDGDARRLSL